jgi:hypothetical protein
VPADPKDELIASLRAILASPNQSAKALAAKVSASHQLAGLLGVRNPARP